MWEKILIFLGYKYILNINTGEVHDVTKAKLNCGISKMAKKNKKRLTYKGYDDIRYTYVNHKYVNGCVHCNNSSTTDKE